MRVLTYMALCAALFACAFAAWGANDKYESGPLPNLRLKKQGLDINKVVRRTLSSPVPCVVCCSQRRAFERSCDRFDEVQAEFQTVQTSVNQMTARLQTAQETLRNVFIQITRERRMIERRLERIADMQAQLAAGGLTPVQIFVLRARLRRVRALNQESRERAIALRAQRVPLVLEVEDLTANLDLLRFDLQAERARLARATSARDRDEAVLNRCLERAGQPTIEPTI